MIYMVLYVPGGAGFRPPTIGMDVDIDRNSAISQRATSVLFLLGVGEITW